jgi:hypothetical protein
MFEMLLILLSCGLIAASGAVLLRQWRTNPEKLEAEKDESASVAASRLAGGKRDDGHHPPVAVVHTDKPT